jgi:4-amino-4-deoxy-L-arabinose transferase-like glycosyltransferase
MHIGVRKPFPRAFPLSAVLVCVLWAAHLANLAIWLSLDKSYMTYDSHRHFLVSLKIFEEFRKPSPDIFSRCISLTQRHPPLVMMATAPFYFVSGTSQHAGILINSSLFLAVLLFATYGIGRTVAGPGAGLLASFIVTMYPVVFNQLKVYMLDLPLTAVVSLSIYFLMRSDNFRKLKYTLLFFISAAAGMLVKATFFLFAALPLVFTSWAFLKARIGKRKPFPQITQSFSTVILFTVLGVFAGFMIQYFTRKGGLWIPPFFSRIVQGPGYLQTWPSVAPPSPWLARIHSMAWYLWGFVNWQVSFFFALVFLLGFCVFARRQFSHKRMLLSWLFGSFVMVASMAYGIGFNMEVSAVRYTMPLLPAVALISALGIRSIRREKLRAVLVAAIFLFGILQSISISYAPVRSLRKIEIPLTFSDRYDFFPSSVVLFNPGSYAVSGSDSGSRPSNFEQRRQVCETIFGVIDRRSRGSEATVTVLPDDTWLWYLQYLAVVRNKQIKVFCDYNYLRRDFGWEGIGRLIAGSDYVIDKQGGWQGESYMLNLVGHAKACFELHKDEFRLVTKVKWPDGSDILIYSHTSGHP